MALEIIKSISIDFHDNKYIMVNAKQHDYASRYIAVTCYNNGDLFNLSSSKHSAYVRYKKADGRKVLNHCRINYKGEVLVELTEQMLASGGICYVDLFIINKGSAIVNIDTGDIIAIDNTSILSTMAFCVNVYESVIENKDLESSYEYDGLNDLMQRAEADYSKVVQLSRSYAIGNAGDIRENENFDNSKYYSEQSRINAEKAKESEENSAASAEMSKSYAIGGTGIRENESQDNAMFYMEQVKKVVNGLDGSFFIPMGNISFSELATAQKASGFMYHIVDDFVTNDTFVEGSGKPYSSGTNVYYTNDGYWDCFGGSNPPIATVEEVKSYLGI